MDQVQRIEGEFVSGGVVAGHCVRVTSKPARVTIGRQQAAEVLPAPQVELIREGDIITAIDVTCSCGQRLRLRCVY